MAAGRGGGFSLRTFAHSRAINMSGAVHPVVVLWLEVPSMLEHGRHRVEHLVADPDVLAIVAAVLVEPGDCNVPARVRVQVSLLDSYADVHCSPCFHLDLDSEVVPKVVP